MKLSGPTDLDIEEAWRDVEDAEAAYGEEIRRVGSWPEGHRPWCKKLEVWMDSIRPNDPDHASCQVIPDHPYRRWD